MEGRKGGRERRGKARQGGETYRVIDDCLVARIFVDVDGDAAQGGYFRSEFVKAGVVLA